MIRSEDQNQSIYFNCTFFSAPPRLKEDDPVVESITVKAGPKSKLKLRCRMQGDPRPYTVWYKNGKRLQTRDNDR